MCGSISLDSSQETLRRFYSIEMPAREPILKSFRGYGSRATLVGIGEHTGKTAFATGHWGLDIGYPEAMRNARIEGLAENRVVGKSFMEGKRAILPADWFFERSRRGGMVQLGGRILSLAAVYTDQGFVVVTKNSWGITAYHHSRMPLILNEKSWHRWADPHEPGSSLLRDWASLVDQDPIHEVDQDRQLMETF